MKKVLCIFIIFSLIVISGCTYEKAGPSKPADSSLDARSIKIGDSGDKNPVPPEKAAEALISSYTDDKADKLKQKVKNPASIAPRPVLKSGKAVPILEYHAIDDKVWGDGELFVSPAEFEKQMDYLKNNHYTVITFDQLSNAKNIANPVLITFDDGYEDNYSYAYRILKKYNFKATIFLISAAIGSPYFLKPVEILEMQDLVNFQSHTKTHPHLSKLKPEEIESELVQSQQAIKDLTKSKVNVLAYPYGDYNRKVISLTRKYYQYGVYSLGGLYHAGDSPYAIKRVYITSKTDISSFGKKLKGNM